MDAKKATADPERVSTNWSRKCQAVAVVFLLYRVPFRSGGASGRKPVGRRAWRPVVFCGTWNVPYETSRWRSEPRPRQRAGRGGRVCFLLVSGSTSGCYDLCTSKEKWLAQERSAERKRL